MNTKVSKCLKNDNEVLQLKNKQGYTVVERIEQDIDHAESVTDKAKQTMLASKVLGAVDLAVEFELITYNEWEQYIDRVFDIL